MPVVTTAHAPFTASHRRLYATAADQVSIVAVSHAQHHSAPEVSVAAVIHHGIDVAAYPFAAGDGGYVLFLGRMHPDKGPHRAIRVARQAGRRILLAAKVWEPAERRYFAEQVEPLLGADAIYVGEVGGRRKLDLLAGATALVNPIRWPEPFGLVMIEALACGTPVLSFAAGAAAEIVEPGRNGFLCTDEDDMAAKLALVPGLDRVQCRRSAATRFSTARMTDDHLALYRRPLGEPVLRGRLHRLPDVTSGGRSQNDEPPSSRAFGDGGGDSIGWVGPSKSPPPRPRRATLRPPHRPATRDLPAPRASHGL
jgi:glycosyltransferase involved in cell wall biosynthesis